MEELESELKFSDESIIEGETVCYYEHGEENVGLLLVVGDDEYSVEIILTREELRAALEQADMEYEACYAEEP